MPKAVSRAHIPIYVNYDLYEIITGITGITIVFCHTLVVGYDVSTYKRTKMIDVTDPLLSELADHFVELHNVGGIELEQWETAHKFVKHFYNTEEYVEIRIGSKK
jgi:hypothetical protein